MTFDVVFSESNQEFDVVFNEVQNVSDGGYERGYADGYSAAESKSADIIQRNIVDYANDDVISVGAYAFYDCKQLKSVVLPNLKTCGDYAFRNTAIETVDFPQLTHMGVYTFADNEALKTACLPKTGSIPNSAFRSDGALEIVDLGSATSIGNMTFYYCISLHTLIIRTNAFCSIGSSALVASPIYKGNGFVYVPDNLVGEYKVATGWSDVASQIRPLSELEG